MKLRIRELALSRGIKNAYQLQVRVGLTPTNASKLFNDRTKLLSLPTIEKLCRGLECEPNELFSATSRVKKG